MLHPVPAILKDVSVDMKKGDFLTIVGKVGCGKSTLLHAVMQEVVLEKGVADVQGSIAYVEQEPFIFSDTIKANILFGKPLDQLKLERAIRVAQLTHDLTIFGNGVDTVIGERGVGTSGGQKARISFARAVYSDADIILLDDPLSAVDPHVANAIFHESIKKELAEKLVILVTHQLQFLTECPKIMLLQDGRVHKTGTFAELLESGFDV